MASKVYIRDNRSPEPSSVGVSNIMSANKAKNTKPELYLRKLLRDKGYKGYRINYKIIPGSPDICFVSKKCAIFVHGCFWHRCPYCKLNFPKSNNAFWKAKFDRNETRDKEKIDKLNSMGWNTCVIWECQLKKDSKEHTISRIKEILNKDDKEKTTKEKSKKEQKKNGIKKED